MLNVKGIKQLFRGDVRRIGFASSGVRTLADCRFQWYFPDDSCRTFQNCSRITMVAEHCMKINQKHVAEYDIPDLDAWYSRQPLCRQTPCTDNTVKTQQHWYQFIALNYRGPLELMRHAGLLWHSIPLYKLPSKLLVFWFTVMRSHKRCPHSLRGRRKDAHMITAHNHSPISMPKS